MHGCTTLSRLGLKKKKITTQIENQPSPKKAKPNNPLVVGEGRLPAASYLWQWQDTGSAAKRLHLRVTAERAHAVTADGEG